MSLEQALEANTAAVLILTEALKGIALSYPKTEEGETLADIASDALKEAGKVGKADAGTAGAQSGAEPQTEVETAVLEKPVKPPKIVFADLAGQFKALLQDKGRDVAVGVLQGYGAAKLGDIPEKKWAEVQAKIAEAQNG